LDGINLRSVILKSSKNEVEENITSKASKAVDLVEYQVGSVVSRTLFDKKAVTVTLFAFDGGQGLSEHTAPYDALVTIIDGEAEVTIASKPFRLTAGEMIIMPANKPHSLRALSRFKMLLIMIRSN
jgi:quercetin dioxygenase-like cupin family protein